MEPLPKRRRLSVASVDTASSESADEPVELALPTSPAPSSAPDDPQESSSSSSEGEPETEEKTERLRMYWRLDMLKHRACKESCVHPRDPSRLVAMEKGQQYGLERHELESAEEQLAKQLRSWDLKGLNEALNTLEQILPTNAAVLVVLEEQLAKQLRSCDLKDLQELLNFLKGIYPFHFQNAAIQVAQKVHDAFSRETVKEIGCMKAALAAINPTWKLQAEAQNVLEEEVAKQCEKGLLELLKTLEQIFPTEAAVQVAQKVHDAFKREIKTVKEIGSMKARVEPPPKRRRLRFKQTAPAYSP